MDQLLQSNTKDLVCGTLYLYSAYSPQLATRLDYTASQASKIAMVGSTGSLLSGPIAGFLVDQYGLTVPIVAGSISISGSYFGLYTQFYKVISKPALSCLYLFFIGTGSTLINAACLKCCASKFPQSRGMATSIPIAMYGLSALFYSLMGLEFFPGDTGGLLRFLAISSAVICLVNAPIICHCDWERRVHPVTSPIEYIELESMPSQSPSGGSRRPHPVSSFGSLFKGSRFWALCSILGIVASLGQLYIYSCGYIVRSLTSEFSEQEDYEHLVQQDQQLQVALISISSCVGRVLAGLCGDLLAGRYKQYRGWLLIFPATLIAVVQGVLGFATIKLDQLSAASIALGLGYGFNYSAYPALVCDLFGLERFSMMWGIIGLSPIVPTYFFTKHFGKFYDSKVNSSDPVQSAQGCKLGTGCYNAVFQTTFFASCIIFLLLLWHYLIEIKTRQREKKV